jgi:hypothetical protein
MELDDYIRQVDAQLRATASLADDRTQQIATALSGAAAPAVRLAIMAALSAATDEITAALLDSPGSPSVSVRLDGDEIRVDVVGTDAQPTPRADDGDATARISLRLSEGLKTDVETAAARDGVSVNTWLVRAATAALSPPWVRWAGAGSGSTGQKRGGANPHHISGWISG